MLEIGTVVSKFALKLNSHGKELKIIQLLDTDPV